MEKLPDLNEHIRDENIAASDVSNILIASFPQDFPQDRERLITLATALIMFSRRKCPQNACPVHFMRLLMSRLKHYSKQLTEQEFSIFKTAKADNILIAELACCLAHKDTNPNVTRRDANLEILPEPTSNELETAKIWNLVPGDQFVDATAFSHLQDIVRRL